MTAVGELEPAVPRWHGAGHGARPAHCDADRAAAVVSHRVRCACAAPLTCRPSSGAGACAIGPAASGLAGSVVSPPWTSIRPNSAATDQERRAEITDGRGRGEITVPLSKYHHFDIVLILKRYRTYSHSSPAPAYAWERGRVPGGGGRGRRSSGRGVKVQAARRQATGRREGRPGRSRGGRLAGRA